jgi:hypothetical protein
MLLGVLWYARRWLADRIQGISRQAPRTEGAILERGAPQAS